MSNDCLDNSERKHCPDRHTPFEILVPGHMQILACVDAISGKAQPGSIVKVRVNNLPLEKTKTRQNGYWRIPLECPLPPGCHVVFAISSQRGEPTERACFMVGRRLNFLPCNCQAASDGGCRQSGNIGNFHYAENMDQNPEEAEFSEEYNNDFDYRAEENRHMENAGPELPPSPELLPAPEILYPAHEQEINESIPIVNGKAQADNVVIVCIRGMMCSRTRADDEGNFSVSFPRELTKGSYTVTALQADSRGNRSELIDHSFTVAL